MASISIIIPFLNEEENIERLSHELLKFTDSNKEIDFEILLINDGSTDDSVSVIKRAQFPRNTRLINLSKNFGSHAALRAGILHAKGDLITFLYADLQDSADNVIRMYNKSLEGYDIVWAHRKSTNNSFLERLFSKKYSSLMKKYVNVKYPAQGFDIVLFSKKVATLINQNVESNSSIFLQILNLGFNDTHIEYEKVARKAGKSKWTLSKKVKLLIDSFVAFSFAPIRFVSMMGISFFVLGVLWTGYIVLRKVMFDDLTSGWPALISVLMIGFGITNISLGIIAEYLWRTLDASRKRPVFIIEEIADINNTSF
jgi:dolichol-phosphate mannosyltransferase